MFRLENYCLLLLALMGISACSELTAPASTTAVVRYDAQLGACDIDQDSCPFLSDVSGSYALVLTSFDAATLTLSGMGMHGSTRSVQLTTTTLFHRANLRLLPPNPIFPNDPIFPTDPLFPSDLLQAYDDALTVGFGDGGAPIYSAIAGLAAARVPARIWLDTRTGFVRAFRPIN